MWFIGVEVEKETSAPPPKNNPGSSPAIRQNLVYKARTRLAVIPDAFEEGNFLYLSLYILSICRSSFFPFFSLVSLFFFFVSLPFDVL